MYTKILSGDNAKKSMLKGIKIASDIVKTTIGPKGRDVAFYRGNRAPERSNDGKKIVHSIQLKDKFESIGLGIQKDLTEKVEKIAGDNTSAATVIFSALSEQGFKKVSMGANPILLKEGMEKAKIDILENLKKISKPIKSKKEIEQIATISSESKTIGKMVADIFESIGKDGLITTEETQGTELTSEITQGMKFNSGIVSPHMVTDKAKEIAELKNPLILVSNKKIFFINEVLPIINQLVKSGKKEMVIIADEIGGEALDTFIVNKVRGAVSILCVKAPGYGEYRQELLEDIALMTGTTVISDTSTLTLENVTLDDLGKCDKIIVESKSTTIFGGKGKKTDIEKHVSVLKEQKKKDDATQYNIQKLEERIANLTGGQAIIRIGATNESDISYLKDKIEDTLANTKGAIEEGIVIGGGIALIKSAWMTKIPKGQEDFVAGYNLVLNNVDIPFNCIVENAMRKDSQVILSQIIADSGNKGYNAKEDAMVPDMFTAGIIDSLKSISIAFKYAVDDAAAQLTIEHCFADFDEETSAKEEEL